MRTVDVHLERAWGGGQHGSWHRNAGIGTLPTAIPPLSSLYHVIRQI